ncbi:hypothetical protein LXL04_035657 [Taraxacum kok-saghyz]
MKFQCEKKREIRILVLNKETKESQTIGNPVLFGHNSKMFKFKLVFVSVHYATNAHEHKCGPSNPKNINGGEEDDYNEKNMLSQFPYPKEAAFKAAWPIVKLSFLKPTRGETPVRSTQACFPPIHPKTKISAGLRVDLPSNGSVKKLTDASFLAEIPARLNTSKITSLTMSCLYLKPGRSLQCIACSPKESKHALRQIGHNSSTGNSGIKRRYLRMVRYSTGDI